MAFVVVTVFSADGTPEEAANAQGGLLRSQAEALARSLPSPTGDPEFFRDQAALAKSVLATENIALSFVKADTDHADSADSDSENQTEPAAPSKSSHSGADGFSEVAHPELVRAVHDAVESDEPVWISVPGQRPALCATARIRSDEGPYCVLLTSDLSEHLADAATERDDRRRLLLVFWLIVSIPFAAALSFAMRPLGLLDEAVSRSRESQARRAVIRRLSQRGDEIGALATGIAANLAEADAELSDQQSQLQMTRTVTAALQTTLNSMTEGVIAVSADEIVTFTNEAALRLAAPIRDGDPRGKPLFEIVRVPDLLDVVRETLRTARSGSLQFREPRHSRQLLALIDPLREAGDDHSGGAVIVLRDVTELRRLERTRRDFVSGVSHELKTPLTVIRGATETLLDGAIDDREVAARFVAQIAAQSERLLQLVFSMLQLQRAESPEQVFSRAPVDLCQVVSEVLRTFRPMAVSSGLRLEVDAPEELFILSDQQAVQTIVSNLIDNAVKYTPDGGTVSVRVAESAQGCDVIVKDTGPGIPKDHQDRIFERFYRVDRDRNRERGGSGLGLAIVKRLCEMLGAEIRMESRVGEGSEFHVRFPDQE